MFRELWRKKVLIVFLAAMFVLFPAASVRPAQALSKTILVSVGIEKSVDGYMVFGEALVNNTSGSDESAGAGGNKIVSAAGETVEQAFDKITADLGRKVSLAYCNLIVIGSSLAGENIAEVLDYFLVKFEVSNNALLVWTDADVAEILEKSSAEDGLLETVAANNQKNVFKRPLTLDRFCKDYLKGRNSYMSMITLEGGEISNPKKLAEFEYGVFSELA